MEKSLSLGQYLGRISATIKETFQAPSWVTAEIVSVKRHSSGHVYFELAEYDVSGKEVAKTKATLWSRQAQPVLERFSAATGGPLREGIKILVSVIPSLHPQYGFSLNVQDIDPAFTLGDLEAKMALIRETLTKEGVYDRNKAFTEPFDYFSVVVVSPADAAGLGDFRREADILEHSGLVRFHYVSALFQGQSTEASLCEAIREACQTATETNSQAIIIIRGGGAKTDLAYVNELSIARAVCLSPVPVMVGIGHERDFTILDEVALMRFDTPSKVIAYILSTVCRNVDDMVISMMAVLTSANKLTASSLEILNVSIRSVCDLASRFFERESTALLTFLRQAFDFSTVLCDKSKERLDRDMEFIVGLHPRRILKQGFSLVTKDRHIVRLAALHSGDRVGIQFQDGTATADIVSVSREAQSENDGTSATTVLQQ